MCRVRTFPVNKHSPVCNWAQDFPSNHLVVSMLEDSVKPVVQDTNRSLHDEQSGMKCSPCSLQEKQEDVFCFCVNCCEYLCANCYTYHAKFKLMRSHEILKGHAILKDISHFREMSDITLCALHREREVEYKCLNHNQFICSSCVKSTHRNCDEIADLATLSDRKGTFLEYMDNAKSLRSDVEKVLYCKINDLEGINRKATIYLEQRRALLAELKRLINYYEQSQHTDIKGTVEAEQARLSVCIAECTSFNDTLSHGSEFADVVMKHGTDKQAAVVVEKLKTQSEKIKTELAEFSRLESGALSQSFLPAEESDKLESLKTLLESRLEIDSDQGTRDVNSTGADNRESVGHPMRNNRDSRNEEYSDDVSSECIGLSDIAGLFDKEAKSPTTTTSMSLGANDQNGVCCNTDREQLESEQSFSFLDCGIRKLAEYDISLPSLREKRCSHLNSELLSDGSMAFIDDANDCLKVVSSDFKIVDFEEFDTAPFDLAVNGDDMIAVAVGRTVCLFKIDNVNGVLMLRKEKSFLTKDVVYSLCVIGENIGILFSDLEEETDDTYIEIRNKNGKIMRSVDMFRNKSRYIVDLYEPYTIRSRYPDELLVCEPSKLKAFGLNGNLRWFFKYSGPSLQSIAFDDRKNIYICDRIARRIHQISASSYRNHRVLITNTGIRSPRCVLINSKTRTLVVGFEKNNLVQVYKFV